MLTTNRDRSSRPGRSGTCRHRRARLGIEPLESRRVLSTFVWSNRGNDDFADIFGGQAEMARTVVDAAMDIWERIIVDFNHNSTPSAGHNTFELEFFADSADARCGAATDTGGDIDGVPTDADITIRNCSSRGWFLDPTPFDNSEFQARTLNDFTGIAFSGTPAGDQADLLTVVLHEIGHAVGISQDEDFLLEDLNDNTPPFVDTGVTDALNPGAGTLWTYNFGADRVEALFTDNNGGPNGDDTDEPLHIAGLHPNNTTVTGGVTFFSNFDLMNPAVASRSLPSVLDVRILEEVYGYTVTPPQQFGTFHAMLNQTTGDLLIRGNGQGPIDAGGNPLNFVDTTTSNDSFILSRSGSNLEVHVRLGTRVPGNGTDLQDMISSFPLSQINTITIAPNDGTSAIDGNDSILLDLRDGPINPAGGISINGGSGTNSLRIFGSQQSTQFDVSPSTFTVNGTTISLSNIQEVDLQAGSLSDNNSFHIRDTSSQWTNLNITGSHQADLILIDKHDPITWTEIDLVDGDDEVYFSLVQSDLSDIRGTILIFGHEFGSETVQLFDFSNHSGQIFTVDQINVFAGRFESAHGLVIAFSLVDDFIVHGGSGNDRFTVQGTPSMTLGLNGGLGDDSFLIGNSLRQVDKVQGIVDIDGGAAGHDVLVIDNSGSATGDHVTVTDRSIGASNMDDFFGPPAGSLFYERLEAIELNTARAGSTVAVQNTHVGTEYYITTGPSSDHVILSSTGINDLGDTDGIVSPIFVDGSDGQDVVDIVDNQSNRAKVGTISVNQVGADLDDTLFGPYGYLEYINVSYLSLFGSPEGNTFYVTETNSNTSMVIQAGQGDDQIWLDANRDQSGGSSQGIRSSVSVTGISGADLLRVENSSRSTPITGTVKNATLGSEMGDNVFGPGGSLTYSDIHKIELISGTSNDTWRVMDTAAFTQFVVLALGLGDDYVQLDSNGSSSGGTVDLIRSHVIVNGDTGVDRVDVHDDSDNLGDKVHLTADTLGLGNGDNLFGTGGGLEYYQLEELRYWGSSGNDRVEVQSSNHNTEYQFDLNSGNDDVTIVATLQSRLLLQGNSSTSPGDSLSLLGDGSTRATLLPHAVSVGDGELRYDEGTLEYKSMEYVLARAMEELEVVTPGASDMLEIDQTSSGSIRLQGTSQGVAISPVEMADIDRLTVEMGLNEPMTTSLFSNDRLLVTQGDLPAAGVDELYVSSGYGNSNRIEFNGGQANLHSTNYGDGKTALRLLTASPDVNLIATQSFSEIIVNAGAHLGIGVKRPRVVVETETLNLAGGTTPTATIDVGRSGLIVNYPDGGSSPLPAIQAQIEHARSAGATPWSAAGITSSSAALRPRNFNVYAEEATEVFGPSGGTFRGMPIAPGDQAVLIRGDKQWSTVGPYTTQGNDARAAGNTPATISPRPWSSLVDEAFASHSDDRDNYRWA